MIELNRIYNMDCLEGMKSIPDGSIDCIICDLPYGTTRNQWDSVIPLDKLWEQYERIIKPNGAIVLFSQQPFTSVLVASNLPMFKYEWIWEKRTSTGHLNSKFAPLKKHENICVFSKAAASYVKDASKAMTYNPQWQKGKPYQSMNTPLGKNYDSKWDNPQLTIQDGEHYFPKDIIKFNRDRDEERLHPTQKPVELLEYLIRTYSNEEDTILDNCMGSGTTAVACIKENRNFIGFELNEEYVNAAEQRIEEAKREAKIEVEMNKNKLF